MSNDLLKGKWLTGLLIAVAFIFLIWLSGGHFGLPAFPLSAKTIIAFLVAAAVLVGTSYAIFQRGGQMQVEYVIAFDITVFVVIGFALLISASTRWQAACLTAGAALLGGGFFGFIFGMPLSAASAPDQGAADANAAKAVEEAHQAMAEAFATGTDEAKEAAKAAQDKARKAAGQTGRLAKHSLLAEAGSTLSKLIAGATLVQIKPIFDEFKRASAYISVYLLQDSPVNGATLGGATLLYFIFLGFLSGLFLPAYFMQDFWDR